MCANIDATQRSKTSKDDWGTPLPLFNYFQKRFDVAFTLDPCTSPDNPLGTPYFFTEADDGLKQSWRGHVVYCNPPYSKVRQWIAKAWEEADKWNATTLMLTAARPDTRWWWDFARYGDVYFIKGRITFVGATTGAAFPSAVILFGRGLIPRPVTRYLELPEEVRRCKSSSIMAVGAEEDAVVSSSTAQSLSLP